MKTRFKIFMLLISGLLCASLSSCDEDVFQAQVLTGKWQGDWGMYYDYEYRGKIYTFSCYNTQLEFFPEYSMATNGTGRQIDYYATGPYTYQYYYFRWSIQDGIIRIFYPYDPALNTCITEYSMNSYEFKGYFINSVQPFRLTKWADYHDWSTYNSYYSYGTRDYYPPYYAPSNGMQAPSVEIPAEDCKEGKIVRRGNRYNRY